MNSAAAKQLQCFKNKNAASLGMKLLPQFGKPDYVVVDRLIWLNPFPNIMAIKLVDESISHGFPAPHNDFVYSKAKIKLTAEQQAALAFVSGSIIVDRLRGLVIARCGALIKNQVTLGFVYDISRGLLAGRPDELKAEYARRIKNNIVSASGAFPAM